MSTTDTAPEVHVRTRDIVQRIFTCQQESHGAYTRVDRRLLNTNPAVRVLEYRAVEAEQSAEALLHKLETWFGADFRFRWLNTDWRVTMSDARKFTDTLRVHAYVMFNVEYLKSVVSDLRRQCDDYKSFDTGVYEQDAISVMLDSARDNWNRIGVDRVLQDVCDRLRARFSGLELTLLTQEHAVQHMQDVLEGFIGDYVALMEQSRALHRQAAELIASQSE